MIIGKFIKDRFQPFGYNISEADLLEMSLTSNINTLEELTANNLISVRSAILGFIPKLLLRPKSVSESGFSMSFDTDSIIRFYNYECKELGLENKLSGISDGSNLW